MREVVYDTREVGEVIYISIVQKEGDVTRDVEVYSYDSQNYKDNYRSEFNNYDLMLLGLSLTLDYINAIGIYEEEDVNITFNNKLLTSWVSKGLSKTSKKYYKIYEECINKLDTMRRLLGDKKLTINTVAKNEAKKYLTNAQLKNRGFKVDGTLESVTITNRTDLRKNIKNKERTSARVTGNVIRLENAN